VFKSLTSVQLVPLYNSVNAGEGIPPVAKAAVCIPKPCAPDCLAVFKLPPLAQVPPGTGC
jgi:hypothetical protein